MSFSFLFLFIQEAPGRADFFVPHDRNFSGSTGTKGLMLRAHMCICTLFLIFEKYKRKKPPAGPIFLVCMFGICACVFDVRLYQKAPGRADFSVYTFGMYMCFSLLFKCIEERNSRQGRFLNLDFKPWDSKKPPWDSKKPPWDSKKPPWDSKKAPVEF